MKTNKNVAVMVLDPRAELFREHGRHQKQSGQLEQILRDQDNVRLVGLVHTSHFEMAKQSPLGRLLRCDVRATKHGPAGMVEEGYDYILGKQDAWQTEFVMRVNHDHSMAALKRMHVRLLKGCEVVLGQPRYEFETLDGNCQYLDRMLISTVEMPATGWNIRETHHVQGYSWAALQRVFEQARQHFVKACAMKGEVIPYGFDLAMLIAAGLKGAASSFGSAGFKQRQFRMEEHEREKRIQSYSAVLAAAGIISVGVPVPA